MTARVSFSVLLALATFHAFPAASAADAGRPGLVGVEIQRQEAFAGGQSFGNAGPYVIIDGRLRFETDPADPANARVADLDLAPRNARGLVEHWSDFTLLLPAEPARGNGCLLYDVHNRGNKLALWTFNDGERSNHLATAEHAGNGYLLREGYSVLWTGWSGDVIADENHRLLAGLPVAIQADGSPVTGPNYVEISVDEPKRSQPFFGSPWGVSDAYPSVSLDNSGAVLTMRPRRDAPGEEVPGENWAFARWEDGAVVPDPTSLYLKEGFRPGWLYDLVYEARDPRVSGLGLTSLRDAVAFFRHAGEEEIPGAPNPLAGAIDRALVFGVSQSGRLVHHFLHEGFNLDPAGRTVFDGAILLVAGAGKGLFNHRFGMATVYNTAHRGAFYPADSFPFAPQEVTDPLTGETADSLSRLKERGAMPRMFFVQSSTEYWNRAASLAHTDLAGKTDLEMDPAVRLYLVAGSQHLDGGPLDPGASRYPRNPVKHRGPVLRALLHAMDRWVSAGQEPPASRYPRLADGTLGDLETFRASFPAIPEVETPVHLHQPLRLDPGPRWREQGIADHAPPLAGQPCATLVPAVDADGNEIAGIRLPEIAVPLGTAAGWNLRADLDSTLADLDGAWFAFPATAAEREASGDPRPSVAERYPDRAAYLAEVIDALIGLRQAGYLLDEDVTRQLEAARERFP